jgi:hypothetical protein
MQHREEYQHQYSQEEKSNNLVGIAGEPTIIEDIAVGTKIARITILVPIKRKSPKPISRRLYLQNLNLIAPPLQSRRRSRRRTKKITYYER